MKKRFELWNKWRKQNLNGWVYKILVLIGIEHSPTFEFFCKVMGKEVLSDDR